MSIAIVPAGIEHAEGCAEAVLDSDIEKYYQSKHSALRFMEDAVACGQLFVGLNQSRQMVGFVKYSRYGGFHRYPYIQLFGIMAGCRGRGLGTELLLEFERTILAGQARVFLLVSDFNAVAQRFYRKNGYEEVGRIPDFLLAGVAEVIMMKRLPL